MTDHAKNIEYWADAGIVENTNETAMTIQGARDLRRLELYAASAELRRLQAENASLWALAKFGYLVIGLISQGGTLDRDMVIDGMLKTGVAEVDQEGCLGFSPLAKLPEERE